MPTGLARIGPEEVGILADFSHAFAASLDVGETLRRAVVQIAEHMNAEAAAVFLVDDVAGDIVCRACAGPVDVVGLRVQAGRGIVGRAIAEKTGADQYPRVVVQIECRAGNLDADAENRSG